MRLLGQGMPWWHAYVHVLAEARHGRQRSSRAGDTYDLGPTTVGPLLIDRCDFVALNGRPRDGSEFARVERLCYLAGVDPDPVVAVAPAYHRYSWADEDGNYGRWPGAYGLRLAPGLRHVVNELWRRPDSRRAVAGVWNSHHGYASDAALIAEGSPDVPCTLALTFWLDRGLHVHATMRSTDVWYGLYYDLPAFAWLGHAVAHALNTEPGTVTLTTTSLHLYAKDWRASQDVQPSGVPLPHGLPDVDDPSPPTRWEALRRWALNELHEGGSPRGPQRGRMGGAPPEGTTTQEETN